MEWRIVPRLVVAAAMLYAGGVAAQTPGAAPPAAAPAAAPAPPASTPPVSTPSAAAAQDGVGAWRVDCGGDGKTLDCRAFQQLVTRETNQLVAQAVARLGPDKQPLLALQLPLGISVSEPVVIRVDGGREDKAPLQTCTNTGCFVSLPLKDPLLASMRTGAQLKLSLQDTNKRTVNIDLPLLGFALAFDKATK